MRDMEVVDGTANDSTADLDNATQDGTLLSNSGKATATGSRGESKAVDDETANSSAKSDQAKGASKEPASNASAPQ